MISLRKGNLKLAVNSLRSTKARSGLTMLGIIIGVTAVVCTVCIGQGVKQQIAGQIGKSDDTVLTVRPNAANTASLLTATGNKTASITDVDIKTIQSTSGVKYTVPLAAATGSITGDHTLPSPLIIATSGELPQALGQKVYFGGFFDDATNNRNVVLGSNMAQKLFDDSAPLGQTLKYRGQQFIVTGVFSEFPAAPFSVTANFNDAIFMSYSTAQTVSGNSLSAYEVLAGLNDPSQKFTATTELTNRLLKNHGGSPDLQVLSGDQASASSDQTIHLLTMLIAGVAAIALIVGGVGIMDVMLVSVTERTHEIGLRKAIGASNRQILSQFIAEAFVLSATGAIAGLIISVIVVELLKVYTDIQPILVWQVMVLAPLVAIAVGILFGTAPALKAARKDPIEALRHE